METKSLSDKTLFFCNFFFFLFLGFGMSVLFRKINYFEKVADGSVKHIILGLGYLAIFIALPLWVLSWATTRFIITRGQIVVIDWFGLKSRKYQLPSKQSIKIKNETAPYKFRIFPIGNKYNEYKTIYLTTNEGRKLRIQSRYYSNFDDLIIAIKKNSG